MDRSYDSLKGQKVTPASHPWRGLQGGSAPCVEISVLIWAKIINLRLLSVSLNFLKIRLKIIKKNG